nr:hypothetical protein [Micromonospora sp. DSM 115978]
MASGSEPVDGPGLGRLISVHRQRRVVTAGAWVVIAIVVAVLTLVGWGVGGWGGSLFLLSVSGLLTVIGVAGYGYLAPVGDPHGRHTISVYDRGLLVGQRGRPPEPVPWSELTLNEPEPDAPPWKRPFLRYTRDEEREAAVQLDGYVAERGLLRAVRAGTGGGALPEPTPVWRRPPVAGVAAAVVLAVVAVVSLQVWQPRPAPPPTAGQLRDICEGQGEPQSGAAPYAGDGPHRIAVYLAEGADRRFWEPVSDSTLARAYPDGWLGEPDETQLVVCVRQQADVEMANCGDYAIPGSNNFFGRITSVRAYRRSYQLQVYEVVTGRQVLSTGVSPGREFTCPTSISARQQRLHLTTDDLIHEPTAAEFVTAIEALVTGPATE